MGFPTVNLETVEGFLKVYNSGGLYLLFDGKSKQAMVDFANIALKSYVLDLQENAKKLLAAKQAAMKSQGATAPLPQETSTPPQKSSIILTD
jgi:hypothetical protein